MRHTPAQIERLHQRKVANLELAFREFKEKRLVLKSKPSRAIVELTQNCNFRCPMCEHAFNPKYRVPRPKFNMPMRIFEKIAAAVFDTVHMVDLRGFGETTILPQWPELVEGLDAYPLINWHLVTNLSLPRDDTWGKTVRAGFVLGFSCDGATKETFEAVRAGSRFDRILHNLEVVTSTIRESGKGHLYFITTVQKRNYRELPQIIELARRFSVPEVQFKMVLGSEHEEGLDHEPKEEVARSIKRSLSLAQDYGIRLSVSDSGLLWGVDLATTLKAAAIPLPKINFNFTCASGLEAKLGDTGRVMINQRCFKPYHYAYFSSDGRVGTCNHMMQPDLLEMGNLKKQSFGTIWNGKRYQEFRRGLVSRAPADPRCQWCFSHRLED